MRLSRWFQVSYLRLGSIALDLLVAVLAFYASYVVVIGMARMRFVPGIEEKGLAFASICLFSFVLFGVTRSSWRYVSLPDLMGLVRASAFAVASYTVAAFLVSRAENVPRSVPVLTLLFLIVGLSSTRILYRLTVEGGLFPDFRFSQSVQGLRRVLVLGTNSEAESFIRDSRRSSSKTFLIAGLLDDERGDLARSIHGVKVRGRLADLETIVERFDQRGTPVVELVVAERDPSRARLNDIVVAANAAGLKVTRIPSLSETASIVPGSLLEPKPIEIGDLLGRPEIVSDFGGVASLVEDHVVLATGAGGSIGSELCRQIAAINPRRLILADSSEHHTFMLDKELRESFPGLDIATHLVDVRDRARVEALFSAYKPEVVFHAAALKHVPLVEENPLEGIKTNVLGTRNVADAAVASGASTFVMISTDKAVNPTNVMGATKRAAEAYCQALDVASETTRFKTVRFGNVLGSNGSVVPLFRDQIAAGGPVTVTHPNVVRYFMTIPEAVRLVLHASAHALRAHAERGKIMVLDMGKPVRIVDLAERMIQLAGFRPRVDVQIVFTGLRPGEKLYEELFDPSEIHDGRTEDGYFIAAPRIIDRGLLHRTLDGVETAAAREDVTRALELLSHIVPEYRKAAPADMPAAKTETGTTPSLMPPDALG